MNRDFRVGFCVSGHGRLFRAAATQHEALGIIPALVVAQQKASPELDSFCQERSIRFVRMQKLGRQQFNAAITRLCVGAELDLLCLTFDRIIPAELVRHYDGRIINLHPAHLPAFTGTDAIAQALAAGAKYIGATIHEVDEGIDTGAIIAQCLVGARRNDTPAAVGARLFGPMRLMFLQVIRWYAEGRVERDVDGRVWVRDAVYGELPVSPAIEHGFPD
ncbi:MAG: hypothetical protein EXQ50_13895 [Acidobacteria bacterium]|nr:hypothetical protein [Acidobacteriota bacterium]